MRKIAVIGAGPAGMIFCYGLLRAEPDFEVTIYSDRTADQWLNHAPPTGTAFHYANVIEIERRLGMDHWHQGSFGGYGVHLDFCPAVGAERLTVKGSFGGKGAAIDQRLRVSHWLEEVESLGARLVIESVTPERADHIAAENDLTVLAAGKADLANLIGRDPARSVYDKPQRNLAMAICTGVKGWTEHMEQTPVKFYFFADAGEFFWVPYSHKSGQEAWCVLFEAKQDGPMDRFGDCRNGEQIVEMAKTVMGDLTPWDYDQVADMELVPGDAHAWLKGRFAPTVRNAFGRLPSGNLIMPVGDTAITFDPIGGQGGNCANRNADFTASEVIARGDKPFDTEWMSYLNAAFWKQQGWAAYTFNNILLEPLTEAGMTILGAAAQSRKFADDFFIGNFPTPNGFFPYLEDAAMARELVAGFDQDGDQP